MTTDDTDPPDFPDANLEIEALPPLSPGMPDHFRERLALALKTVNADVLAAAEACYRGTFSSVHEYLVATLCEHLPEFLLWILECINPDKVLEKYEAKKIIVWIIRLSEDEVMVFESLRLGSGVQYTVPHGTRRVTVYGDS